MEDKKNSTIFRRKSKVSTYPLSPQTISTFLSSNNDTYTFILTSILFPYPSNIIIQIPSKLTKKCTNKEFHAIALATRLNAVKILIKHKKNSMLAASLYFDIIHAYVIDIV